MGIQKRDLSGFRMFDYIAVVEWHLKTRHQLKIVCSYSYNFFVFQMASSTLKKVSFLDNTPTSTLSGENLNMDPETAKKLFEIGATIFLVTKH